MQIGNNKGVDKRHVESKISILERKGKGEGISFWTPAYLFKNNPLTFRFPAIFPLPEVSVAEINPPREGGEYILKYYPPLPAKPFKVRQTCDHFTFFSYFLCFHFHSPFSIFFRLSPWGSTCPREKER
jgi:hypothetical protein